MSGEVDVAIVGGGLVGASLAIALEPLGLRVALVEGVAPQAASQPSFDDRTSALGNGTRRIFETLGVWGGMATQAAPIRRIHVSDAGRFGFARLEAAEHGIEAFGYVITNRAIGAALRARLAVLPGLELRMPAKVTGVSVKRTRQKAVIRWKRVTGATSYKVTVGKRSFTTTQPRFTLKKLKPKSKATVKIVAVNSAGSSPVVAVKVKRARG